MAYAGYCTIDQIKERCLISIVDHTKDTQLEECGTEASRHIDELLRSYLTERQKLTLAETLYVNCVVSDIGKEVRDDTVKIGSLLEYDNTLRVWLIHAKTTIADLSVVYVNKGTGEGVASGVSVDDVTEQESPHFIFKTLPLVATIPATIGFITADFGAAIFLRRYMPAKYSEEWWTSALGKIEEFIRNNWYKGAFRFT